MNIIGLSDAHDSGAVLISNNRVVVAVNEERFTRKKLDRIFPYNSLKYIFDYSGLKISDIDFFGCGGYNGIDSESSLNQLIKELLSKSNISKFDEFKALERIRASSNNDIKGRQNFIKNCLKFGISFNKLHFCDHHRSHALTAFYPSNFEESIILVSDGRGDFKSTSLWKADRKKGLTHIHTISELNSIGAFYSFITKALGFIPHRHEGKTTGLAAQGKYSDLCDLFNKIIYLDKTNGEIKCVYGNYYIPFISASLPKLNNLLKKFDKKDIAFAAQFLLEKVIIEYINWHLKKISKYRKFNICLSGGIFANVKLNYEISKLKSVKSIFISQNMGDGGIALGGALYCNNVIINKHKILMPNVYLGPSFNQKEIISILKKQKYRFQVFSSKKIIDLTTKALSSGKIVGWFYGRMEYGPRALGSRSILASADDKKINDTLNKRLNRTEFMPFAPITTELLAKKCFYKWSPNHFHSKFMTTCYDCKKLIKAKCPAVVHVDNTARPQIVFKKDNILLYDLINNYFKKTSKPALINTSFNHHEEPIVCSPSDALRSLSKNNVDILIIENVIVYNDKKVFLDLIEN